MLFGLSVRGGLHEKKRRWAPFEPSATRPRAVKNTDANANWGKQMIDFYRKEELNDKRALHLLPQDELIDTIARFATCMIRINGGPYKVGFLS